MAVHRALIPLASALIANLLMPSGSRAQVIVTPDGQQTATRLGHTGGYTAQFTVTSIYSAGTSYSISCVGSTGVTCNNVSPSSLSLGPYGQAYVTATYSVGTTGSGRLTVSASGSFSDNGWYSVPIQAFHGVVTGGTEPNRVP